jgi:OmcA/MtrC family decaheme c-type cytochrome
MSRFNGFLRWAWSILAVCTLAFALGGCDGDTGATGPAGAAGPEGPVGPEGPPGPLPDDVMAAIDAAEPESCSTCHQGVGDEHQAIYDKYVDPSTLALDFTAADITTVDNGDNTAAIDVTFRITTEGMPFIDAAGLPEMDQKRFIFMQYFTATGTYGPKNCYLAGYVPTATPGEYVASGAACEFVGVFPLTDYHIYGYLAEGALFSHEGGSSELPEGSHVHLYDNVANEAVAFGAADAGHVDAYESAANVAGCEKCHGIPYMKHGYRAAEVAPLPDFAACKSCHYDTRNGGHTDWQYMVDEPFNWATGVAETADYSYTANVMNDAHMSHAMEFPYPMSISNCNSCHEGKLDRIIADATFTVETCKSCHAVQGLEAWPGEVYAQGNRAPPLEYLWKNNASQDYLALHQDVLASVDQDCGVCHETGSLAPTFSAYHTGYDVGIYDDTGTKYAALNTVSIDQITVAGDLLTINFSANNVAIIPEVLVSFYGWDSKNFIVGSHERDGNVACQGYRPGCKMEYTPESSGGGANPLFMEDAASIPGAWMVTLDMSALQLTKTDLIPQMILDGVIKKAEVTITPELVVNGNDVVLTAAAKTFDLGGSIIVDDYFKGANATVSIEKCNVCHDSLASTFHDGSGRGGDGIESCKNCHTTTFPGSHLEMASRAIDSYVHAIHSFQPFDLEDVAAANDPVFDARAAQHILHTFPNFTIRNCEACHLDGKYNVPDQAQSMPGVLSASWDIADRAIGLLPEYVSGPASRACGGCHRADLINADLAGDLASLNAHTKAFGTLEENDDEDMAVFGIIDKIMSMFQ